MITIGEEIEVDVVCSECGTRLEAKKVYPGYDGDFYLSVEPCSECKVVADLDAKEEQIAGEL